MKLRQVALAADQLEPVRSNLLALLGATADYVDPGVGDFGLVNSVMAIGDTFLEIVAPNQDNTAAGRLLERRGETCGYMVLMQVDSYADFNVHLDKSQVRKIWEVQRSEVSACHVHPKDIGAAIVSFDEMRPPESWLWAGPEWEGQRANNAKRIVGCQVQAKNPALLAQHWGDIMQTAPQSQGDGSRLGFNDGTFIDFVAGDNYEGICAITFEVEDSKVMYAQASALGLTVADETSFVAIGGLKLIFVDNRD